MHGTRHQGTTLIEVLSVVTILGIIAGILTPNLIATGATARQLALAASEITNALHFAQAQATRTGAVYGVEIEVAQQRLRLYRLDTASGSPVRDYTVYHPIDKKPYQIQFQSRLFPANLNIASINYRNVSGSFGFVEFAGTTGVPRYSQSGTTAMLQSGTVEVVYRNEKTTVTVQPMTGRTSVL